MANLRDLNSPPNPFQDFLSSLTGLNPNRPFSGASNEENRERGPPQDYTTETPGPTRDEDDEGMHTPPSDDDPPSPPPPPGPDEPGYPHSHPHHRGPPPPHHHHGPPGGLPFHGPPPHAHAHGRSHHAHPHGPRGHAHRGRGAWGSGWGGHRSGPPNWGGAWNGSWGNAWERGPRHCSGRGSHHSNPWGLPPWLAGLAANLQNAGGPPGARGSSNDLPFDMSHLTDFLAQFTGTGPTANPTASASSTNQPMETDFRPAADIFSSPSAYTIHVSLPGARREDIGVHYHASTSSLRVSGVVYRPSPLATSHEEGEESTLELSERTPETGVFDREIRLGTKDAPASVVEAGIEARLEAGVLSVRVPRVRVVEKEKARKGKVVRIETEKDKQRQSEKEKEKEREKEAAGYIGEGGDDWKMDTETATEGGEWGRRVDIL